LTPVLWGRKKERKKKRDKVSRAATYIEKGKKKKGRGGNSKIKLEKKKKKHAGTEAGGMYGQGEDSLEIVL